jgi:hypothetical protein
MILLYPCSISDIACEDNYPGTTFSATQSLAQILQEEWRQRKEAMKIVGFFDM